jgi:hypothetical protein
MGRSDIDVVAAAVCNSCSEAFALFPTKLKNAAAHLQNIHFIVDIAIKFR